ncbi:MAG: fucose isomerase [Patescibacteria group bacterium]|nr:fucose isomerase [Patescibacteria group bacterium]
MQRRTTFGLIVGTRGFFPSELAVNGRRQMVENLKGLGYDVVVLAENDTQFGGAIESHRDAKQCAELFRKHGDVIDGVIVTLPNFGDEKAVAEALQMAGLNVPILVHAFADDCAAMTIATRRDSFCGKFSVCNNLTQLGIPFSLTQSHTLDPASDEFKAEVDQFAATCRVVQGLRGCRIGAIGTRPDAFRTMRYSETLLAQVLGIQVITLDLSEVIGQANALADDDETVKAQVEAIKAYVETSHIPLDALLKMAKLAVVINRFREENEIDALAIQCWTALQQHYGVVPCAIMSMLSDSLFCAACEVDVCGAVSMRALQLASGNPAALVDWNNNGPRKGTFVAFHCSNIARSFLVKPMMGYQAIIAGTVGKESTYGTIEGAFAPNQNVTLCRMTTNDADGQCMAYTAQGVTTEDQITTFGGFGIIAVPKLDKLVRIACRNGFPHHVAIGFGNHADAITEAFENYFGMTTYRHERPEED